MKSLVMSPMDPLNARRRLLRFLAASPLVATPAVASSIAALFSESSTIRTADILLLSPIPGSLEPYP